MGLQRCNQKCSRRSKTAFEADVSYRSCGITQVAAPAPLNLLAEASLALTTAMATNNTARIIGRPPQHDFMYKAKDTGCILENRRAPAGFLGIVFWCATLLELVANDLRRGHRRLGYVGEAGKLSVQTFPFTEQHIAHAL